MRPLAKKSTANQPYAMPFPMVNNNQYNNNNNHVYFRQSPYEIKKRKYSRRVYSNRAWSYLLAYSLRYIIAYRGWKSPFRLLYSDCRPSRGTPSIAIAM